MTMSAPSLTLRSIQNEETGIDISVPRFQEEEAPLGGTSILYEISVLTKLDLFKTRLHRNEDIVQFSVYKAYREVEDLYNKLNKKYPKAGLPPLPKYSTIDKYTFEERVAALDRFMKAVSTNVELCHSSTFTHFIGINSTRLPSFTVPSTDSSAVDLKSENFKSEEKMVKVSEDLSEVFPKVKNVAPKTLSKPAPSIPAEGNTDLFEEVKMVKESEKVCDVKKSTSSGGLFDDFEDENLFSATAVPKPVSPPKEEKKVAPLKPKRKEAVTKTEVNVDDSEIIIKDRKPGDISLFDEQDLGDYVTKDEEALFLVSSNTNEDKKKNTLLFSSNTEFAEPDSELNENLDDLLNLNPLPTSPALNKSENKEVPNKEVKIKADDKPVVASDIQTNKPVPLPRKKSLGKSDTEELMTMIRPEELCPVGSPHELVMPRKVFLTKPEVPTKPTSVDQDVKKPAKPPVSTKPSIPKKPKPPTAPKPSLLKDSKNLDAINANQPENLENKISVSSLSDDLNKLDILKYIEQEQKTLESEPSLFD